MSSRFGCTVLLVSICLGKGSISLFDFVYWVSIFVFSPFLVKPFRTIVYVLHTLVYAFFVVICGTFFSY